MSGGSANLPAGRPGSARSDSCARARHCRWRSGLCSRSPASGPRAASRSRDSPRPAVSLAASGRFRGPLSAARYRLAGAGLVTPDAVESGRGPLRTIYAVTPQGREFVRAWLAAPVDHVLMSARISWSSLPCSIALAVTPLICSGGRGPAAADRRGNRGRARGRTGLRRHPARLAEGRDGSDGSDHELPR